MMLTELQIYFRFLYRSAWARYLKSSPVASLVGFYFGVLTDMRVYIAAIGVLVTIDMITGIMASLHRGEKYSSRKLLIGLVDRFILYGFLFNIMLMLDAMLRGTIDYGRSYITIVCCTIIGFYEASSCVENLVSRFPNRPFLRKIGNALNLLEKKYEDSTVNQVSNIIESSKFKEDEK